MRGVFLLGRRGGWSAVETVVVLLILGVITAYSVSRFQDSGAGVEAEAAVMRANLRFAQGLAMSNNTHAWGVSFLQDGYQLLCDGAVSPVSFPNENGAMHPFSGGVKITSGTGTLDFDEVGSPGDSDYVVVLGGRRQVRVTAGTGFVP